MARAVSWSELPLNLVPEDIYKTQLIPGGKQAIYTLCHRPGFPVLKVGKKYIIPRDKLRDWIEKQTCD